MTAQPALPLDQGLTLRAWLAAAPRDAAAIDDVLWKLSQVVGALTAVFPCGELSHEAVRVDANGDVGLAESERLQLGMAEPERYLRSFGVVAYQLWLGDFDDVPGSAREARARLAEKGTPWKWIDTISRCLERPPSIDLSDLRTIVCFRESTFGWCESTPTERIDHDVQVSVYRPRSMVPNHWYSLLAFAHLAEKRPDDPADAPDPFEEVERRARALLAERHADYRGVTQDAAAGLPQGGMVRFVPEIEGIEFNPPVRTFVWRESVHEESFRIRASSDLAGQTARGRLSVYSGAILIAEVSLSLRIAALSDLEPRDTPVEVERARAYRKIFASYAHSDHEVVAQFDTYAHVVGDRYLIDVRELRSGEEWSDAIERLIEQADIFQLFWSNSSMYSAFCRREWEHALSLRRQNFVRPVYWQHPMPKDEARGLPPEDLAAVHFTHFGVVAQSEPPESGTESRRPAASRTKWSRVFVLSASGVLVSLAAFLIHVGNSATLAGSPDPIAVGTSSSPPVKDRPVESVEIQVTTVPAGARLMRDGFVVCESTPCSVVAREGRTIELTASLRNLRGSAKVLVRGSEPVTISLRKSSATPKPSPGRLCEVEVDGLKVLRPCK